MEPIRALMIVEMIGRPKEHLEETLKEYIKKISSEKGMTLINEKLHEPKKIEHKKDENKEIEASKNPGALGKETKIEAELFSTFAEIEFETDDINILMRLILFYMPSHIEILSPDKLEIENFDLNSFFNEIIRKMHEYDGIAKSMVMENKILKEKFQQILSNLQRKPVIKAEQVHESPAQIKRDGLRAEENLLKEEKKGEKVEEVNVKPKKSRKKKESS